MNQSSEFAALQRQNRLLRALLAVTLIAALASAAASVLTLALFLSTAAEVRDALSQLDIEKINKSLDMISSLADLMDRISGIFGK